MTNNNRIQQQEQPRRKFSSSTTSSTKVLQSLSVTFPVRTSLLILAVLITVVKGNTVSAASSSTSVEGRRYTHDNHANEIVVQQQRARYLRNQEVDSSDKDDVKIEHLSRIVGGHIVEDPKQFPTIVALFDSEGYFKCGATLILPDVLLCAAHCTGMVSVAEVGRYDLSKPVESDKNSHAKRFNLVQKIDHPLYGKGTFYKNDIDVALYKLSDGGTTAIAPVIINGDPSIPKPASKITVAGWGATSEGGMGSPILKAVEVQYMTNKRCQSQYTGYAGYITDDMFCANHEGEEKDACQGDSGGPAYRIVDNVPPLLVGIVSWGIGCAREEYPGVYARPSHVIDWIEETACKMSDFASKDKKCPIKIQRPVEEEEEEEIFSSPTKPSLSQIIKEEEQVVANQQKEETKPSSQTSTTQQQSIGSASGQQQQPPKDENTITTTTTKPKEEETSTQPQQVDDASTSTTSEPVTAGCYMPNITSVTASVKNMEEQNETLDLSIPDSNVCTSKGGFWLDNFPNCFLIEFGVSTSVEWCKEAPQHCEACGGVLLLDPSSQKSRRQLVGLQDQSVHQRATLRHSNRRVQVQSEKDTR